MLARKGLKPLVIRKVNGFKVDCFAHAVCLAQADKVTATLARRLNVPKVDKKTEKEIVKLVDKVIDKKRSKVDSLEEEREIDRLVYGLYGLSEEEIKIIEKCN